MIKKFVECLVPITQCNIKCEYCYVMQQSRRNTAVCIDSFSLEKLSNAFMPNRWGGQLFVNLCGEGETLLWKEIVPVTKCILEQGHIINITTNGTITPAIDELLALPNKHLQNVLFSFSLHYIELKNKDLLQTFAKNVTKVINSCASCFVQINLCDSYITYIDEIKEYCQTHFGALPHVAVTRDEHKHDNSPMSIFTSYTNEEYKAYGNTFDSKLFDFTYNNFMKKQTNFCYAGELSYRLNLNNGDLKRCYFEGPFYNVYENPYEKIPEAPVGFFCGMQYCINSSHFQALGVVPENKCPSYVDLRTRENVNWIKANIIDNLGIKLFSSNNYYLKLEEINDYPLTIYGAGEIAKAVVKYLISLGVTPDYVIVSNKNGNPDTLNGIEVSMFTDKLAKEIQNHKIIVASDHYKTFNEIKSLLNSKGIYNITNAYKLTCFIKR